jgi:hypothetical protein
VITLDTSGLLALIDSKDPDHEACTAGFAADRGRVLTSDRRHFPVVARGEKTITVLPA